MSAPSILCDRLIVAGCNHRSGTLELRDRLFVEDAGIPAFLERLSEDGVQQALLLSTCDRVEVTAIANGPEAAEKIILALAANAGLQSTDLAGQTYVYSGAEAVRHIFAVAASLDSQIVGEPQVLGQVKAAHRIARAIGTCGNELETVLQAAYGAAKRVRSETTLGERPVSIAAAALRIARDVHGDLAGHNVLVIGTGDMGEMIAADLLAAGVDELTVIHPREDRANAMANRLDCHVAGWGEMARLLAVADVILAQLGTRQHVLTADMVRLALHERRRKPVFLIDAAVPGDIEPAINRLDGAFLYDITDLERVAAEGRASREAVAGAAWRIVEDEATVLFRGLAERTAVPSLIALRRSFEDARREVLKAAGGDAEEATRLLVNRLLHAPSEEMRTIAAQALNAPAGDGGEWERLDAALKRLFRLDAGGAASEENGE